MPTKLISYELNSPEQDYGDLYRAIRGLGPACQCLSHAWTVETSLSCKQIHDRLQPHLDVDDGLLVVALAGDWATIPIAKECDQWLERHLQAQQPEDAER